MGKGSVVGGRSRSLDMFTLLPSMGISNYLGFIYNGGGILVGSVFRLQQNTFAGAVWVTQMAPGGTFRRISLWWGK